MLKGVRMEKIRLAVVDDHPMFREGVASILATEPDIEIVALGSDAASAIQIARTLVPDIMLIDIHMPGGGVHATQAIKEAAPSVKLVILTGSEDDDDVLETLKAGAHAYLLKGVMTRELLEVLHLVKNGQSYVSPVLAAGMLRGISKPVPSQPAAVGDILAGLSERERQILFLIADGMSNLEIGQQLYLAEKTIKHYVTSILQKLNVQSRVQAALLAQKSRQ
jgi:DNA-binding NarL/FixJ family response regulator